jgi:hypothetical protein
MACPPKITRCSSSFGQEGKSLAANNERFPGVDMRRLIRAGLVEERPFELAETQAHAFVSPAFLPHYQLTDRDAQAIGIDPRRPGQS